MVEETAKHHLRFFSDKGRSLELSPILRSPVVAVGTSAERPKASIAGRLFYEKDTGTSQVDDGSAWNAFGGGAGSLPDLSDVGTVSYTAGQVLRADGTDFDSDVLHHTDLDTISPDDHHVKTTSSDIDHALITNVLPDQHHVKTGDNEVYGLVLVDLAANRPAAGIAERWFISSDTLEISYDDGTAWNSVGVLGGLDLTAHEARHESAAADAIPAGSLNPQDPTAHAPSHKDGGADELDAAELAGALGTAGQYLKTDGAAASWTSPPTGAPSADPIKTVNQGTVTLGNGEDLTLWRATLPAGKSIKVIEAGIQPSGTASLVIEVYNQTDAVSIYSNNVSYDDGSYGTPLASGGAGDDVEIRLSNASGATQDCSGWVTFVVE